MTSNVRKPSVNIAGVPQEVARALQPVKTTLELLTGTAGGIKELKGLKHTATNAEIILKINEIIRRLNASGGDHV